MTATSKSKLSIGDAFSRVAFWQLMAFVFLGCFVWVVELFDLSSTMFGTAPMPFNLSRTFLLSGGIITAGIIAVGHTYEQQRAIVKGVVSTCLYCHRVQSSDGRWEHVNEYFLKHYPVDSNHLVCSDCETMLADVKKYTEKT
ncbi:MAG: hypothetical protein E4H02_09490 [Lentisphaerales bacterium]|nr:MAG: hypothetical protein E4H02_09490 [Lentisphaerales bacterium]